MAVVNNINWLAGTMVPSVYIKDILLETATPPPEWGLPCTHPTGLSVTLTLCMKADFNPYDAAGSWLHNQDLKQYLRIKVVQSTQPMLTWELSASQDAILYLGSEEAHLKTISLADHKITEEDKKQNYDGSVVYEAVFKVSFCWRNSHTLG